MALLRKRIVRISSTTILAAAIGSVIGATANPNTSFASERFRPNASVQAIEHSLAIHGAVLVGPVQSVHRSGRSIQVLGHTIRLKDPTSPFLPAQYVAVFGSVSASGEVQAQFVQALDEVYAPGSSPVLFAGHVSTGRTGDQSLFIAGTRVDGYGIPGIAEWTAANTGRIAVVVGTQAIDGASIVADQVIAFSSPAAIRLAGVGLPELDGTLIRGIDGSGSSSRGIDGSGAQVAARGIDGSGAAIQGIDGSGAAIQGIDGSGAATRGIDGSGAAIQGIDGSGAATRGIDGSGAAIQGIDGSGAATRGIDGSGAAIQGIDGSGAATRGIDGSGGKRF